MKVNKVDNVIITVEDLRDATHTNWGSDKVYLKIGKDFHKLVKISDEHSPHLVFTIDSALDTTVLTIED